MSLLKNKEILAQTASHIMAALSMWVMYGNDAEKIPTDYSTRMRQAALFSKAMAKHLLRSIDEENTNYLEMITEVGEE